MNDASAEKTMILSAPQRLRELLKAPGCLHFPTCYDALSAVLVQQAGFPVTFMSGAAVAASRLGGPDVGLITQSEMVDQLRYITAAVPDLPVMADGETGYGNAMNVRRTVTDLSRAGAAAVMIEDQVEPKRCGHFDGKSIIPRLEARMKIRAAVEAAKPYGTLIIARTDARAVEGFEPAMQRCQDFVEEGADIVFLEAPTTRDEMKEFASRMPVPALANVVPGGKSPVLSRQELEDLGFKLAGYHPLLFAAIAGMQESLARMRAETIHGELSIPFSEYKRVVGLSDYLQLSDRYRS